MAPSSGTVADPAGFHSTVTLALDLSRVPDSLPKHPGKPCLKRIWDSDTARVVSLA